MTIKYLDSKRIQMIAGSDTLGSAVDGTNSSTATNVSTPINGQTSVEFGNNEYANSMGTTSSFSTLVGSNWSVSFWLHYAGVGNNGWGAGSAGSGNLGTLLTTGQISNTGNGFVIGLDDNNQEKFYLLIASGQGTSGRSFDDVFTDAIALASDKWHHYVFNFDNTSDELKIYRDGSLVQTIAYGNTVPTPSATTTSAFTMGRQGEMDQRYFIGEMADVGIFNRNLTTTEISYLFNSFDPDSATSSSNTGKSISTMSSSSGLLTNYKLDDVNYTNSAVAPTKPTNVETNSILIEKDTGDRYWFNGTTWGKNLPTPTYQTTYANSTGWTQVNTAASYWAIASNTQQFQNRIANNGSGANYDLGLLDSYDEWLLRFELTVDSSLEVQYNGDAVTVFGIQGRTDNTGSVGGSYGTARAQVQMQIATANSTRRIQAKAASDTTIGQSGAALNFEYTNNTKYYIEVKKTGATSYTIGVGTNSDYTTGRTEGNITATLTGLRYLHFESWGQNASYESRNGGVIENLKFYAGVSS
jgi:hypothetical protein